MKSAAARSKREQEAFDFAEASLGVELGEAGEFAADHDVILVAGEHELVLLDLDKRDDFFTGENLELGDEEQQFHGGGQGAEAVAQLGLQAIQSGLVRGLGELAIDVNAMLGLGDVGKRDESGGFLCRRLGL